MRGDSESTSKNTLGLILQYPEYSNLRSSENSLASDLVLVPKEQAFDIYDYALL